MQQLIKPNLSAYLKTATIMQLAKHHNIYRPIENRLLSIYRFRGYDIRQIIWHICMIYNPKLYNVIGYSLIYSGIPEDEYLMNIYNFCNHHNL